MPVQIPRLRRWFAAGAIFVLALVASAYFYARWRVRDTLKEVPGKIGVEIQQSAQGFTMSKSEQGRTLFKIQASKAIQYKEGGRAELHDVSITLYGRDAARFDQIYGTDFEYDPKSGDVTSRGEVQIDLESNPAGLTNPDQSPPKELKNPIHLKTRGLVFNQKSGDAYTDSRVDFSIPQATGSAVGVKYTAKNGLMNLVSKVNVVFSGDNPITVNAEHGAITKDPRVVILDQAHLQGETQNAEAQKTTLFLDSNNALERVLAAGDVQVQTSGTQTTHTRSDQLELVMSGGTKSQLLNAVFSGNVQTAGSGAQQVEGAADKVKVNFYGKNLVKTVHSEGNVHLMQHAKPGSQNAQDMELRAPVVNFYVASGRRMERAETSGAAQIAMSPAGGSTGQHTVVTAGKFDAKFDDEGQLTSIHGAPSARIVSSNPGQHDKISISNSVDALFQPGSGIQSVVQQRSVAYSDDERQAWGDRARYTPSDQMLVLTGSPRIVEGGLTTTSRTMRLNRATGDAVADGDVKSTYSDLKQQTNGALLASSSPVHVTSKTMTAHQSPAIATYTGDARLWQDANIVEAPSIEFDRNQRTVVAHGTSNRTVSTVLVQTDSSGKVTPVTVTANQLTYTDTDRKAHFEGGATARGTDATVTSEVMDVFLLPSGQNNKSSAQPGAAKLDRIVATKNVVITEPTRRAVGEKLVYTAADDKFVLSGGTPSIFDAERGKITGVSLTFFRHDDRVLVEGNDANPTVTQTRVAR